MASVQIINATRFSVTIDRNQNGVLDLPAETALIDFGLVGTTSIASADMAFPITIRFDQRGQIDVTNGDGVNITPLFYFCDTSCTSTTAAASTSSLVYISPTGTVAMMCGRPGSTDF